MNPLPRPAATGVLCFVQSGVDCDDFASSAPHQQDALQPLGQDLQELHVWSQS